MSARYSFYWWASSVRDLVWKRDLGWHDTFLTWSYCDIKMMYDLTTRRSNSFPLLCQYHSFIPFRPIWFCTLMGIIRSDKMIYHSLSNVWFWGCTDRMIRVALGKYEPSWINGLITHPLVYRARFVIHFVRKNDFTPDLIWNYKKYQV